MGAVTDAINSIPDRSLAAKHGSCMTDADLRILGGQMAAGHGSLMADANLTPINSLTLCTTRSRLGTVHLEGS